MEVVSVTNRQVVLVAGLATALLLMWTLATTVLGTRSLATAALLAFGMLLAVAASVVSWVNLLHRR